MLLLFIDIYDTILQMYNDSERKGIFRRKSIAVVAAMGLAACVPSVEPQPPVQSSEVENDNTIELNRLEFVILDDPFADFKHDIGQEAITQGVREANEDLARIGGDENLLLPDRPVVHTLSIEPSGLTDEGQACYSERDIREAKEYITDDGTNPRPLAFVASGALDCGAEAEGALAYYSPGMDITMYANGLYFDSNLILHEEGHRKLGHATVINCPKEVKSELEVPEHDHLSDVAIDELVESGCDASRNDNGDINVYGDRSTAMGTRSGVYEGDVPYTFVELNTIDSSLAPIELVNASKPGVYEMSLSDNHLHDVVFDIARDHPLTDIDATISKLYVGAEPIKDGNDRYVTSVRVIAAGSDTNYSLNYTRAFYLEYDRGYGTRVIYTDQTLNMQVSAEADPADPAVVLLHVRELNMTDNFN